MRIIALFSLITTVFVSCSSDSPVQQRALSNAEMKEQLNGKIDSLEGVMEKNNLMLEDDLLVSSLLQSYIKYTEMYPADFEFTPEYLYKSAALSRAIDLPIKAIKIYDKILKDFPNWEKAPEVAFLQAFTYDEDLKEAQLAKEAYEEVIAKYPEDYWAVQAEQRLSTVEMSDEELLEFLLQRQKETASEDSN